MNEKEALTGLKNLSQIFKLCSENDVKLKDFNIMNPKAYKEAIETILDLYNKEKENMQYWKDRYKNTTEHLALSLEHMEELEATLKQTQVSWYEDTKKIEQLKNEIEDWKFTKKYVEDEYIHKDKIKEKIEETNNEKLNYSEDEYYLENEVKGYAIDKLKELLEENKNV